MVRLDTRAQPRAIMTPEPYSDSLGRSWAPREVPRERPEHASFRGWAIPEFCLTFGLVRWLCSDRYLVGVGEVLKRQDQIMPNVRPGIRRSLLKHFGPRDRITAFDHHFLKMMSLLRPHALATPINGLANRDHLIVDDGEEIPNRVSDQLAVRVIR